MLLAPPTGTSFRRAVVAISRRRFARKVIDVARRWLRGTASRWPFAVARAAVGRNTAGNVEASGPVATDRRTAPGLAGASGTTATPDAFVPSACGALRAPRAARRSGTPGTAFPSAETTRTRATVFSRRPAARRDARRSGTGRGSAPSPPCDPPVQRACGRVEHAGVHLAGAGVADERVDVQRDRGLVSPLGAASVAPDTYTRSSAAPRAGRARPRGCETARSPAGIGTPATRTRSRDRRRTRAPRPHRRVARRGNRRASGSRTGSPCTTRRRAFRTCCARPASRGRSRSAARRRSRRRERRRAAPRLLRRQRRGVERAPGLMLRRRAGSSLESATDAVASPNRSRPGLVPFPTFSRRDRKRKR